MCPVWRDARIHRSLILIVFFNAMIAFLPLRAHFCLDMLQASLIGSLCSQRMCTARGSFFVSFIFDTSFFVPLVCVCLICFKYPDLTCRLQHAMGSGFFVIGDTSVSNVGSEFTMHDASLGVVVFYLFLSLLDLIMNGTSCM